MTIPNMRSWSTPGIAGLSAPTMFRLFLCWGCLDLFFRWYFMDFTMVKTISFTTVWEISLIFFLAWNKQNLRLVNVGPIQGFQKDLFFCWQEMSIGEQGQATGGCEWATVARKTCHFFPAALKMGRRDVGKLQFHCVLTRRTFIKQQQASRNFVKLEPSPWRILGSNARKKQEAVFFRMWSRRWREIAKSPQVPCKAQHGKLRLMMWSRASRAALRSKMWEMVVKSNGDSWVISKKLRLVGEIF